MPIKPTNSKARKFWEELCAVAEGLRTVSSEMALDYLVAEKLFTYISLAENHPEYAEELPSFVTEIRRMFTAEDLTSYLKQLQKRKYRRPYRPWLEKDEQDISVDSLVKARESEQFYKIRELLEQRR
jgi:hypothetical protein